MKKLRKNLLIIAIVCIMGFGTVANAETSYLDITVTRSGQNQDPISMKTVKDNDGDNYFYVTPTGCSGTGVIFMNSINYQYSYIQSITHLMNLSSMNETTSYGYGKSVPGNQYYYLSCKYGLSNNNDTIRVWGRYTP